MSTYLEHVTAPGDRWDLIAYKYYGDAMLMHHILRANPDAVSDPSEPVPLVLAAGITLRVPILEPVDVQDIQLPPWKRTS